MGQRTRRGSGQGRVRRRHVSEREIEQRQLQPAGNAAAVASTQQVASPASATSTVLDAADHASSSAEEGVAEAAPPQAAVQGKQVPAVAAEPPATDFATRSQQLFPTLDRDGDGYLGDADIAAAVTDASITGLDAAVVGVLNHMTGELEELSDDEWFDEDSGITLADLQTFATSGSLPEDLESQVNARFYHYQNRANNSASTLYGPGGAPTLQGVQQGSIGDCYFLAAVGSVVATDPSAIQNMIADNGDNTFTVTFPGRDPVTVTGPTDAELAQYVHGGSDGIWSSVLEKAFGTIHDSDSLIPHEGGDGGGRISYGIEILTGSDDTNSDTFMFTSDDTTRERLTAAFDEGRIVTTSTAKSLFSDETGLGLPRSHAYSVIGWDAATDTVTIRNPWGSGERTDDQADGVDDGVFTMTIDEFTSDFEDIAYE